MRPLSELNVRNNSEIRAPERMINDGRAPLNLEIDVDVRVLTRFLSTIARAKVTHTMYCYYRTEKHVQM